MDLKIRLINPGDEVFAAMNIFPNIPVELKLSRNSEVTQIRLRKEQYKSNANCNDSEHYIQTIPNTLRGKARPGVLRGVTGHTEGTHR